MVYVYLRTSFSRLSRYIWMRCPSKKTSIYFDAKCFAPSGPDDQHVNIAFMIIRDFARRLILSYLLLISCPASSIHRQRFFSIRNSNFFLNRDHEENSMLSRPPLCFFCAQLKPSSVILSEYPCTELPGLQPSVAVTSARWPYPTISNNPYFWFFSPSWKSSRPLAAGFAESPDQRIPYGNTTP